MKEKILKLKLEGKSYNEIKKILGCSKSTISYHCGKGQKIKNYNRTKKNRKKNRSTNTKVLKLRALGKSYDEIAKQLNLSKSTVCYHCGDNQKVKHIEKTQRYRKKNSLIMKVDAFKNKKTKSAIRDFQRRVGSSLKIGNIKSLKSSFNHKDVINKFGIETLCYLTGEKINLLKDKNYSPDHITPATKGGDNSIDNLGICLTIANKMKSDLSLEEFLSWCKKILQHNGYEVIKKEV